MLLDLATQVSPLLDVLIVILFIVLVYLLAKRVFLVGWVIPQEDEAGTMEMVAEEKLVETRELKLDNQLLHQKIKQAKLDYGKRKINVSKYKQIVQYAKEQITENEQRIKLLER